MAAVTTQTWPECKAELEAEVAKHEAALDVEQWCRALRKLLVYSGKSAPKQIEVSQQLYDKISVDHPKMLSPDSWKSADEKVEFRTIPIVVRK